MSELYHSEEAPQNIYWDRRYYTTFEEQEEALKGSSTLYVGNLNFRTTEQQMEETFSRVGPVKRIIMGLNRETKGHCGFGFVEYYTHEHAVACLKYISGTNCDENIIQKYKQLKELGFINVFIYPGGMFEWLLLQDIYTDINFKTNKKELNLLKYKPNNNNKIDSL